jgi:hypothetical protein
MKCEKDFEDGDKHSLHSEMTTEVSKGFSQFSFFLRSVHLLSSSFPVVLELEGGTCSKSVLVTSYISDVIQFT